MIFDDVEVPRERVFIDGNLDVYNSVMKTTLVGQHHAADHDPGADQARVRLGPGDPHGRDDQRIDQPPTQQMLGEIAMYAEFTRSSVFAAEQAAREYGNGMWCM